MAKTKDRLTDTADNIRPYVERAVKDEQIRQNVRDAFDAARDVYNELMGPRGTVSLATRTTRTSRTTSAARSTTCAKRRPGSRGRRLTRRGMQRCCSWASPSGFSSIL